MVIEAAISNNAVVELMNYVKANNSHQYGAYFERVDSALTAHQNKEPEFVPVVEASTKKRPVIVGNEVLLALRMYANGLSDGGALAKEALEMAG